MFSRREVALHQEHESRTCTTGRSRKWLLRLRAKRSSQEPVFPAPSEIFRIGKRSEVQKRSCSECMKPEAFADNDSVTNDRRAPHKRRIPVAASVERFRNACIHESFAECRVTPFLPDRIIRQDNVELTSVSRGRCCSRFDVAASLPIDITF